MSFSFGFAHDEGSDDDEVVKDAPMNESANVVENHAVPVKQHKLDEMVGMHFSILRFDG